MALVHVIRIVFTEVACLRVMLGVTTLSIHGGRAAAKVRAEQEQIVCF